MRVAHLVGQVGLGDHRITRASLDVGPVVVGRTRYLRRRARRRDCSPTAFMDTSCTRCPAPRGMLTGSDVAASRQRAALESLESLDLVALVQYALALTYPE